MDISLFEFLAVVCLPLMSIFIGRHVALVAFVKHWRVSYTRPFWFLALVPIAGLSILASIDHGMVVLTTVTCLVNFCLFFGVFAAYFKLTYRR